MALQQPLARHHTRTQRQLLRQRPAPQIGVVHARLSQQNQPTRLRYLRQVARPLIPLAQHTDGNAFVEKRAVVGILDGQLERPCPVALVATLAPEVLQKVRAPEVGVGRALPHLSAFEVGQHGAFPVVAAAL